MAFNTKRDKFSMFVYQNQNNKARQHGMKRERSAGGGWRHLAYCCVNNISSPHLLVPPLLYECLGRDWCCRVASLLGVDWRLSRRARCRILEGRRILLGCEAKIRTDGAQLPHLVTPTDTQTGSLLQPGP